MRKRIIAGNWKMNTDLEEARKLTSEIMGMYDAEVRNKVYTILAPPFTHLSAVRHLIGSHPMFYLCAQNVHEKESGAYTGEVSSPMLKSAGCEYVIIGHSERRQYFNENNTLLAKKVDCALKHNLKPIYCVGETEQEREEGRMEKVIKEQLKKAVFFQRQSNFSKITIAYEPVWAIGTGKTATPEQAQEVHAYIRNLIADNYDTDTADGISILYGGSMKPENAGELLAKPDIDGGLIGGASLKSRDFIEIIKEVKDRELA